MPSLILVTHSVSPVAGKLILNESDLKFYQKKTDCIGVVSVFALSGFEHDFLPSMKIYISC